MPVAVHGVQEEAVCDFAPTPCTPFPGQRTCAHWWRLAVASGIHHCPSFVSFKGNGCKVKGLEGQVGEQVGSQQSPKKSTGKKRTDYRARSASSSARQRTSARTRARVFTGNKRSAEQMELSDSISTGWFPFYCCCFSALSFRWNKRSP